MVKPRENRVPIMMSDEEIKLIDDWRFTNRVATRSDAVRRLVQLALRVDHQIDEIHKRTLDVVFKRNNLLSEFETQGEHSDWVKMSKSTIESLGKIFTGLAEIYGPISGVTQQVHRFREGGEISDASKDADEIAARMEAGDRILKGYIKWIADEGFKGSENKEDNE